jgi:hypothetical protein
MADVESPPTRRYGRSAPPARPQSFLEEVLYAGQLELLGRALHLAQEEEKVNELKKRKQGLEGWLPNIWGRLPPDAKDHLLDAEIHLEARRWSDATLSYANCLEACVIEWAKPDRRNERDVRAYLESPVISAIASSKLTVEEISSALRNEDGVTFGPTMEASESCPVTPEVPYGLSECAIAAEPDMVTQLIQTLAKERWDNGDPDGAKSVHDLIRSADGN